MFLNATEPHLLHTAPIEQQQKESVMQHRRRLNVFRAMQKAQREESLHTDSGV